VWCADECYTVVTVRPDVREMADTLGLTAPMARLKPTASIVLHSHLKCGDGLNAS
jgi:hypothetical protein